MTNKMQLCRIIYYSTQLHLVGHFRIYYNTIHRNMNINWTQCDRQMPCRHVVCVADTPVLSWRLARPINDRCAYRTRKIKCLIWLQRDLIRLNPTYWLGHDFRSLPDYTWLFDCTTQTPLLTPWRRGVFHTLTVAYTTKKQNPSLSGGRLEL
jgi:hypothetical protein